MNTLIQTLFIPIQPFIGHPDRALAVAIGFAAVWAMTLWLPGGRRSPSHLVILTTAVLWALFGAFEIQAMSAGWNIRVDLLLSWPLLLMFSLTSAWVVLHAFSGKHPAPENADRLS